MRFLKTLTLCLLPLGVIGANKVPADKFEQFYSKAHSSAPIKLEDATYGQLTSTPRDYSVVVLLTALEARFGCKLCQDFHPEWELLAKSWTRGDKNGESRLIYGTLDFMDGRATFQSVWGEPGDLLEHFLTLCSSDFKPLLFFYSFNQMLVPMLLRKLGLYDTTSPAGTYPVGVNALKMCHS